MRDGHEFRKKQAEERVKQDLQWGGWGHDDEHDASAWIGFIQKQLTHAQYDAADLDMADSAEEHERLSAEFNVRMVKIAALAEAAFGSTVRRDDSF